MYIEIRNMSKTFKSHKQPLKVIDNISLSIEKGEFVCLLGPSGCGKTTLLNILAGFEKASEGTATIDGQPIREPNSRHVTIFQNYGLLPWRSVKKNVELGLEAKGLPKRRSSEIADKYIRLVGLEDFKKNHPGQLSGGMQQRVAIARALAVEPDIIFMDEPFGALDAITRIKMQDDILRLSQTDKKTIVFVTHDIDEAVYLADRIVVMSPYPGRIREIIPVNLKTPRNRTREDFISMRERIFKLFDFENRQEVLYSQDLEDHSK